MTKKLSIIVILAIAFLAVLQCNVFAAETLPEADAKGVITLTEDVILTKPVIIDTAVTLNLNNHNITHTVAFWDFGGDKENDAVIGVRAGGNLTITGKGTIKALTNDCYTVSVRNGGKLTIYDGTYIGNVSAIYVVNGSAEIYGGTFDLDQIDYGYSFELNCKDPAYKDKSASIVTYGGTYKNFSPDNAAEPSAPQSYIPVGYKSVKDGENYKVIEDDDYNFQKALDAGGTVKLEKNLVLTRPAIVTKTVTLDLNGHNIDHTVAFWDFGGDKENDAVIGVRAGGNLTITGKGTIKALTNDCYTVSVRNGGKLTIYDGTYIGNVSAIYVVNGSAEIYGGTFDLDQIDYGYSFELNCKDPAYKDKSASIVTYGGTYKNFSPANAAEPSAPQSYVPVGYIVVQEGEWYKVVDAHTKLTKTDAKAATYTANGNIEYYTCSICGKLFEDKGATKETNAIKVVIPMLIQVNNSGNASVDNVVVDDAITESGNSSVVELPAIENATSVTVPVESVKAVDEANKGLTVETKDTTVTLDAKAVEEVAKQAENATNITIEVTKTEEKTLNKEQKEAIKDKEVAIVLSAKILAGGKEISNFNGGKVKVEIPFTPAEGTKGSDYKVYYIADDGKVEAIPTRYVKEKLVVELEHFSEYVVVKEVANAGAAVPSTSAPTANPNEKDNTPKTGAISVIGLVVAMSVIGLAVLRRKD